MFHLNEAHICTALHIKHETPVQRSDCRTNKTDTFPTTASVVLTKMGIAFNFTNGDGETTSVDVVCDPTGSLNTLSLAKSPLEQGKGNAFFLTSRCACSGGCGVPSAPPINKACALDNGVDLTSIQPLTFNIGVVGQSTSHLFLLAPCGRSGAFCPKNPSYLSSQSERDGSCDYDTKFTNLLSMSPVPGAGGVDDGVALVYSGNYAGTATVIIRCDRKQSTPRSILTPDMKEARD